MPRFTRASLFLALACGVAHAQTLVKDINPPDPGVATHSYPRYFAPLREKVVFSASAGAQGHQPWISDGTEDGTVLLKEINPNGSSFAHDFVSFKDQVLFVARDDSTWALWSTDGTTPGTVKLADVAPVIGSGAGPMVVLGDEVIFVVEKPTGNELWKSNGTAAGTSSFASIGWIDFGMEMAAFNGNVYFAHGGPPVPVGADELWKTDGTAAGTVLVKDILPVGGSDPRQLTVAGDYLYFTADGPDGNEIWRTDGTTAGTIQLADIDTGPAGSDPLDLAALDDGTLLFTASPTLLVRELWKSDGTPGGTTLLYDPPPTSDNVFGIVSLGDEAWFIHPYYFQNTELWRTDGTLAGTSILSGGPWFGGSTPVAIGSGKLAVWTAQTTGLGTVGVEPFISDGTEVGTVLVADVNPGADDSFSFGFTRAGSKVYFSADDGVHDTELHAFDLTDFGGWVAEPYGAGCGLTGNPSLTLDGKALAGETVSFELEDAAPFAPALVQFSAESTAVSFSGCKLYLLAPAPLASGVTGGAGELSAPLVVPVLPSIYGVPVTVQAAIVVAGGPLLGLAEVSNPLEVVVGP